MTTETEVVAGTILQTAAALAPALVAADPKAAAALELANTAMTLLQVAMKAQSAGIIPPDQLVALFASIGQGVQTKHDAWAAMNAADAAKP